MRHIRIEIYDDATKTEIDGVMTMDRFKLMSDMGVDAANVLIVNLNDHLDRMGEPNVAPCPVDILSKLEP